jgi:2-methylisocitrate lyase-like PEP mutase family enzyme
MNNLRLKDKPLWAPLCLDALTARIAERAGFNFGYVSGGALGYAHAVSEALLSVDELADVVRHVTARSSLSIIVDAGVGFGDAVHLTRGLRLLEAAGAAAIEIEDQVAPKRVSHHRGIEHLIPLEEMVDKVKFAVDARTSEDFLVIARTGGVRNESFNAGCDRANGYAEAGADMVLIMPENKEDWLDLKNQVNAPIATFGALGGRSSEAWSALGVSLVIDPFTPQVLAVNAIKTAFEGFMADGNVGGTTEEIFELYNQLDDLAGFDELYSIEDQTTLKD